ncbi:MAG: SDR family oxidoreductase [Ilumatobacteraceae bacterium]
MAEAFLAEGRRLRSAPATPMTSPAVEELSAQGTVVGATLDAGDESSLRAFVASAVDQLGGLDVYVHNTSGKPSKTFEGWQNNFDIDLMALVVGAEAAGEALADGGGSLISIGTSATAEHFASGANSYSAFKAAVTNWTLGQAQVLGAKGIRCNVVSPGPIFIEGGDWDRVKGAKPEFFEATQKTHPSGDLGTADDVANAVVFLASSAAKHINGVNLVVDGGFSARQLLSTGPRGGSVSETGVPGRRIDVVLVVEASTTTSTSPAWSC